MGNLLRAYKRKERSLYRSFSEGCRLRLAGLGRRLAAFKGLGKESLTLIIMPHGAETPRGLRLNIIAAVAILVFIAALLPVSIAFFLASPSSARLGAENSSLKESQAELDRLREASARLSEAYARFEKNFNGATSLAFSKQPEEKPAGLAALFDKGKSEVAMVGALSDKLERAALRLDELGSALGNMKNAGSAIPSIWPIKDGLGHVSSVFGMTRDPFPPHELYFHLGMDCSTYRQGDPIIATADGTVVFAGYQGSYGYCVLIAHEHGIFTRYAHLRKVLVRRGQTLRQGQSVGLLGNTGKSTGPHVHYEVIIGADVRSLTDPAEYLWAKSERKEFAQ